MKHITILATAGSNLGSIDNPRRAFLSVNQYLQDKGEKALFKVQVAGTFKEILLDNGICTLHPDIEIRNLKKTDLIIIPAFDGDIKKGMEGSRPFFPWIIGQYKNGEKGIMWGTASGKGPNQAWFKDPAGNILSVIEEK